MISKERLNFKNNPIRMEAYMMMKNFRSRSKRSLQMKEMDLTIDFLEELLVKFCKNNYHMWSQKHPFKPSIDRLDYKKGYTKDNIRVIWLIENYCKNTFTDKDVIEFCKRKLELI